MLRALGSGLLVATCVLGQTNFPPPPAPPTNPHTADKALLGMTLFFEEQLSATGTVACATCHDFAHGGADPRTPSGVNAGPDMLFGTADDQHGSPGQSLVLANGEVAALPVLAYSPRTTRRRAPTVIHTGYHTHLAYDGSKQSLEQLISAPLFDPIEMGRIGQTWGAIVQKVAAARPLVYASNLPARLHNFVANRSYADLFQAAFGSPAVTQQGIVNAIACYLRTLNADQSKWDLHLHGQAQLTVQEQLGLTLFNSPANGATSCRTCHSDFEQSVLTEGPIAGQMTMTSSGPYGALIPTRLLFHNIGVRPIAEDPGRGSVSPAAIDQGRFRVASLRNVELTAPYFHNGSVATLREVLDFYDRGGDFHVNQAAQLTNRNYTVAEKDAIVALLQTLTDPRVAAGVAPFDRPTLGSQNGKLVTSIGQGAETGFGRLQASAPFAPTIGEPWFQLTVSGATPGTPMIALWDVALATTPMPLNLQLAMTPSLAAFAASTSAQLYWWSAPQAVSGLRVPLPVPNNPALSSQTFYVQWVALEPSRTAPLATSNALRIQLQ